MSLPELVTYEFAEFIPSEREHGKVYISIPYSTAVHNCLCGCGMRVVTPIKPNKWMLTYDGESISLSPSIGNWSFPAVRTTGFAAARFRMREKCGRKRSKVRQQ